MSYSAKYRGEGRSDFHLRTTNSDGNNTLDEVIILVASEE